MTTADFYAILFNEGEGICFGLHEHSNRITTLDKVQPETFQYFSLNPFLVDVDLNKMSPNWKAGLGRRDQVNLTARRNMLFEFDKTSREEQIRIIKAINFPFSTLVWSGGKSHHAMVAFETSFDNKEEYTAYWHAINKVLMKHGISPDAACKDPGRFSRCANSVRIQNGEVQTLLKVKQRWSRSHIDAWLDSHGVKPAKPREEKVYTPLISVTQKDSDVLWKEALRLTERKQRWEPGNRHNFRFALAINCNRVRLNPEEAKSLINTYYWKANDSTVFDALKWETKQWVVMDKTEKQAEAEKAQDVSRQKFAQAFKQMNEDEKR
jgi:hypothetical protein